MPVLSSRAATSASAPNQRAVALWLFTIAALVFLMVTVGGATRLTGSGLSITEWQPLMGIVPPLSDAAWAETFDKYKQIPQYKLVNKGMSLAAFKSIFWWEWGHRFLGRLLGVAFLVPLIFFVVRGAVGGPLAIKLGGLFLLGGAQGALGWYMVQSGLSQRTDVSQYRLAAHLLLASALLVALLWLALELWGGASRRVRLKTLGQSARVWSTLLAALVFLQIGAGALVAGMKAGLAYNTWPLMDGRLIPTGLGLLSPPWLNVFENATTVQFDHRLLAYIITSFALWHCHRVIRAADDEVIRHSAAVLLMLILAQVGLGIWTLLAQVPLALGLGHQAMAILVLASAVWHAHAVWRGT